MIYDKFTDLGFALSAKPSKSPEREIEAVESQIGAPLPKSYRHMLLTFKAPIYFENDVAYKPIEPSPWARDDGTQGFVEFYGPKRGESGLGKAIKTFRSRLPHSVIPIAEAPGGNQICLGVAGELEGKVFLWDHEGESSDERGFDNLYLIAESFDKFVELLEVRPEEELEDDDDGGGIIWHY